MAKDFMFLVLLVLNVIMFCVFAFAIRDTFFAVILLSNIAMLIGSYN